MKFVKSIECEYKEGRRRGFPESFETFGKFKIKERVIEGHEPTQSFIQVTIFSFGRGLPTRISTSEDIFHKISI
jgi:hypothetical protein